MIWYMVACVTLCVVWFLVWHMGARETKTSTLETAREIMGSSMLGIIEVERYLVDLSYEQKEALQIIPFSEKTLKACAKTHVLVADVGLSLLDPIWKDFRWHGSEMATHEGASSYSRRTESPSWRLICKEASWGGNWRGVDLEPVNDADVIPSARQLRYAMCLYFLATGKTLFSGFVATSDRSYHGRVWVGMHGIICWYDSPPGAYDGFVAARKPDVLFSASL